MGEFTSSPVAQDGLGASTTANNGPDERGFGYSCSGADVNNITQSAIFHQNWPMMK